MKNLAIGRTMVVAKGVNRSYSYHSVQLNLDDCISEKDHTFFHLQQRVPPQDVYRELPQVRNSFGMVTDDPDEEYGLESRPHITVLYGLEDEASFFNARREMVEMPPIKFKFGKISSFRTDPDNDVLIVEIISPDLHKMNAYLRQFPFTNKYPEYKPHMTISYIKKGACKDLEGEWEGMGKEMTANELEWSHKDKFKLPLPLGR